MENINFSAFSQDVFDPVEWLNSIFPMINNENDDSDKQRSNSNKKTMANNLVFKLQLMVEETNNSLQEVAQRLSFNIPKVIGEADVLSSETSELSKQIIDANTKLICTENEHSEVIESLLQMDRAKKRLQDLYQALQEANNWSVLSMDVEEVFETGNIEQIAKKISSMQKSLELLSLSSSDGVPLMDKIEMLEKLKDRFEKLIEPMLIEAFEKISTTPPETIEYYSNLFKEFQRSDRLLQYYQQCLRDQMLKEWSTQVKVVDTDGRLLDKLNFLYDRLNMLWKTQINFCMKILYPDDFYISLKILSDIFTDILISMNPSIEVLIHLHLNQTTSSNAANIIEKQKSLIELKQFTNSFVKNLEQNILQKQEYSKCKNLNEFVVGIKSVEILLKTIYKPFAEFNQTFLLLEKERLDDEFDDMQSKYEDMICAPCLLRLFSLIRESYKLYYQYVESYPLLIVEDVIEDLLLKYLNECQVKKTWLPLPNDSIKKCNSNTSLLMPNWSMIQKTLFKFQTLGDFINQLQNFHQQIYQNFLDCLNRTIEKIAVEDQNSPVSSINFFKRFDLFILKLDLNIELRERIEQFIQQPNTLMYQIFNECVEMIKLNAQEICQSMFEYVQTYLNNFDFQLEQELNQCYQETESEDGDDSNESSALTSYSPNEYITQIGQYLLMLPQHLEPFNLNENSAFKTSLQYSIDIFGNYSNMPNNETISNAEYLLECILRKTVHTFLDRILYLDNMIQSKKLKKLPLNICKKIGVDLSYLAAVCEDLGSSITLQDRRFMIFLQMFNNKYNANQEENTENKDLLEMLERMIVK